MKSLQLIIILFCIASRTIYAQEKKDSLENGKKTMSQQEVPPIATDRPDQTETPILVPKGMFQIETGYWVEMDKNEEVRMKNTTYNTSLIKAGISDQFELRLIVEYIGSYVYKKNSSNLLSRSVGFNSIAVGTKLFISEQKGIIPKTSLIAHLQLPYIGHREFRPSHLAPRFRFTMMNTITPKVSLSYNIGGEWDGDSENATAIYTVSLAVSPINRVGVFVEAYGFFTENSNEDNKFDGTFSNDHRVDGGITYALRNNLQLDASAGLGLSKNSPDGFLSCGISWRFPK